MTLRGRYFDGKSSAAREVEVELLEDSLRLQGVDLSLSFAQHALRISPRIGNIPRRIQLPDGGVCELADNDALDAWLQRARGADAQQWVFRLEHRWSYALAALLIITLGTWLFVRYGVPVIAERVAYAIPTTVDTQLGGETLDWLDRTMFADSSLPAEKQRQIRAQFAEVVRELPDASRYRLEFRQGQKLGANAFALPSGIVVVTDELVQLAGHPNEIVAVLAHEVGHVKNRHALRMLLQSSASALVMFGLLGDLSSVSSLAAGVPAVLLHAKYSRGLESEADAYSYAWLRRHGIPSHYFGDILQRLEQQQGGGDSQALSYFASHPATAERIEEQRNAK